MRIGVVALVGFWLFLIIGWVMNFIKIIGALDDPTITPMFIARIIGAVAAPIGAILGWF